MQTAAAPFRPARWVQNRHFQTLAGAFPLWRRGPAPPRLLFPLPEGGSLAARAEWHPGGGRRRTVLLIHGVGGNAESSYMLRAAAAFRGAGHHVIRLNLRGAGEGVFSAPSIYHAGLTADVDHVARQLLLDPRVERLCLVGFSLGGSMILKLAGEWGGSPPSGVAAVATLSAPTDFDAVSDVLERASTFLYRRYILLGVIRQALAFARHQPSRAQFDRWALVRSRTIREYDAVLMVPMHGFRSVQHYYDTTTAAPWLPSIRLPTLMVHAEDDPIIPGSTVRPALAAAPATLRTVWTQHGGHMGWVGDPGAAEGVRSWAVRRVITFFREAA